MCSERLFNWRMLEMPTLSGDCESQPCTLFIGRDMRCGGRRPGIDMCMWGLGTLLTSFMAGRMNWFNCTLMILWKRHSVVVLAVA